MSDVMAKQIFRMPMAEYIRNLKRSDMYRHPLFCAGELHDPFDPANPFTYQGPLPAIEKDWHFSGDLVPEYIKIWVGRSAREKVLEGIQEHYNLPLAERYKFVERDVKCHLYDPHDPETWDTGFFCVIEMPDDYVPNPSTPTKRGSPRRLTTRRFIRICKLIESGLAMTAACEAESVTYQIWRLRISQSARLEARFKKAEAVRSSVRHEQALAAVIKASDRNFIAACWLLERCWPELYALRKVERTVAEQVAGEQRVRVIGLPADELDKMTGPEYKRLENGNVTREVGGIKVIYARISA
jgi:hypothetical protein